MNSTAQKPRNAAQVKLTRREQEILRYANRTDASSQEIAEALCISKRTVDFHLANIYRKLGVQKRIRAIKEAQLRGLI